MAAVAAPLKKGVAAATAAAAPVGIDPD